MHLIIHDNVGYVLDCRSGDDLREPVGVPFIYAEVPKGKRVTGVDVSVTPHQVILEDIPPSEIDVLKQRVIATDELVLSLIESMYL